MDLIGPSREGDADAPPPFELYGGH
jgi:hypothetical protein